MTKKYWKYIFICSILLTSNACQKISDSINKTFNPSPAPEAPSITHNFLLDSVALNKAEQLFINLPQFSKKDIYMHDDGIHYYDDGRIYIKIQSPEDTSFVDEYIFRKGSWTGPHPVRTSINKKPNDDRLFPIFQFSFATAFRVTQIYNEKVALVEGAKETTHVYAVVRKEKLIWYPRAIDGSRETYGIEFTSIGELLNFERK